jgi:hypothetical protein
MPLGGFAGKPRVRLQDLLSAADNKIEGAGRMTMKAEEKPAVTKIVYDGPETHKCAFKGAGFGVIFEDDGETGLFFAADEKLLDVYDALLIYNANTPDQLKPGEAAYVLWNRGLMKAGLYYRGRFQAVIDFANRISCCRTGLPAAPKPDGWCLSPHTWDDAMLKGLMRE